MSTRLILLALLLLSACSEPAAPIPTAILAPTGTLAALPPTYTPTAAPTLTAAPTATLPAAPTQAPSPTPEPSRTPSAPLARMPAGQAVTLTRLSMLDLTHGWGTASEGSAPDDRRDHILRTADGGRTWLDVSPPEQGFQLGFALDQKTAWAVPAGGYLYTPDRGMILGQASALTWRTSDGGATWQPGQPFSLAIVQDGAYLGLPNIFAASLQMFNAQDGVLFLSIDYDNHGTWRWQIYHTSNGGDTWERTIDSEQFVAPPLLLSAYFTGPQTGIGGGSFPGFGVPLASGPQSFATYYQTQDGGRTWQPLALPEPAQLPPGLASASKECGAARVFGTGPYIAIWVACMTFTSPASGYSFAYIANAAGANPAAGWLTAEVPHLSYDMLQFIDAQTGWRITYNTSGTSTYDLQQTRDGGRTWTTLRRVIWQGDLHFLNAADGFILARYQDSTALLVTHDGGRTLEEIRPVIGR